MMPVIRLKSLHIIEFRYLQIVLGEDKVEF